jgi:O-Antigen ligase
MRPGRLRRLLVSAGLAAAVLLVELAVAGALTRPQLGRLLILLGAILGLAAVFTFPLASAAGLMLLTASVYTGSLFHPSIGPIQIHPQELLLFALLLVAVVAPRARTWGGVPGAALAALLACVALSGFLAVDAHRVTPSDAFNAARALTLFASFWVVLRLFPDPQSMRRLLLAGLVCGALAGLLAVPLSLGAPLPARLQNSTQDIVSHVSGDGLGGLLRVRFPGVAPAYVLFWWGVVAALAAGGRRRVAIAALLGASLVAILLSFNRNMWIGLVFGLALMMVLAGPRVRHWLVAGVAVAIVAVVAMFSIPNQVASSAELGAVLQRATTLLSPQHLGQESSLQHRAQETSTAWHSYQRHPVMGVGPGADFGVRFSYDAGGGVWLTGVQRFLHDQWMWLLLVGGIPALLAGVVFIGSAIAAAWRLPERSLSQTALGVGLAMTALSSFVMISLSTYEFCLIIGVASAVVVRMSELERG